MKICHQHVFFGDSVRHMVAIIVILLLLMLQEEQVRIMTNGKAACQFMPMTIMIGNGNSCTNSECLVSTVAQQSGQLCDCLVQTK